MITGTLPVFNLTKEQNGKIVSCYLKEKKSVISIKFNAKLLEKMCISIKLLQFDCLVHQTVAQPNHAIIAPYWCS